MTLQTRALLSTSETGSDEQDTTLFFDRELSWLSFNERVLMQAQLSHNPLGERLRFIGISSGNLDEFYMVRLAGLYQLAERGYKRLPITDDRLDEKLVVIEQTAEMLQFEQQKILSQTLDALAEQDCVLVTPNGLDDSDRAWLEDWYCQNMLPLLSPTTLDPTHPFPFIPNRGRGLLAELHDQNKKLVRVVIQLPDNLPRFIQLPGSSLRFVLAEDAILAFLSLIYSGHSLKKSVMFRVLRDSEIEIDDEADDLVNQFENALRRRRRGNVVSLLLSDRLSASTMKLLYREMKLSDRHVVISDGFVGISDFMQLVSCLPAHLLYPPYHARFPQRIVDFKGDCFAAIRNKDIIVHHPFESFDVVVRFLEQAADDPDVLAIRQTLYRTTPQSPITKALIRAAENGKSVTALIELKARFDEENNIQLARMLERAGAQVAYGLVDLKVHSKLSHVIRREGQNLISYTHCGTGNYHPTTAKIYTDLSFFTCNKKICDDVWRIFTFLTSYVKPDNLEKLVISPSDSAEWLKSRLDIEIENAKAGKPAHVWFKTNAIVDRSLIKKLYKASTAGVKIELCVRGICCLRPGIKGLSENIEVKSIVGRFLEHGRIYAFGNGGIVGQKNTLVYIASADLMPRNLYKRVESFIPLENPTVRQQVLGQIIEAMRKDRRDSWLLQPDGRYVKMDDDQPDMLAAHDYFMNNPSLSGRGSLAR